MPTNQPTNQARARVGFGHIPERATHTAHTPRRGVPLNPSKPWSRVQGRQKPLTRHKTQGTRHKTQETQHAAPELHRAADGAMEELAGCSLSALVEGAGEQRGVTDGGGRAQRDCSAAAGRKHPTAHDATSEPSRTPEHRAPHTAHRTGCRSAGHDGMAAERVCCWRLPGPRLHDAPGPRSELGAGARGGGGARSSRAMTTAHSPARWVSSCTSDVRWSLGARVHASSASPPSPPRQTARLVRFPLESIREASRGRPVAHDVKQSPLEPFRELRVLRPQPEL